MSSDNFHVRQYTAAIPEIAHIEYGQVEDFYDGVLSFSINKQNTDPFWLFIFMGESEVTRDVFYTEDWIAFLLSFDEYLRYMADGWRVLSDFLDYSVYMTVFYKGSQWSFSKINKITLNEWLNDE